jgi:hypothetical protein
MLVRPAHLTTDSGAEDGDGVETDHVATDMSAVQKDATERKPLITDAAAEGDGRGRVCCGQSRGGCRRHRRRTCCACDVDCMSFAFACG